MTEIIESAPLTSTVVIVGAGHAAGELATRLREQGWEGRIVMIGDEPYLPYQRPPLSKAFLQGSVDIDALMLKPQSAYDKANVEVITGVRVKRVDPNAMIVRLSNGQDLAYDKLVFATGGRQRQLPGPDSARAESAGNFHYLRTLNDSLKIRVQLRAGRRLVVVGGGYVGLEVAATAIKHGLNVTVVEAAPRLLARVTSPEMSEFFLKQHKDAGVDVRTGVVVQGFEFDAFTGAVTSVRCSDGSSLATDVVIVGVGLLPNTELAQAAGIDVGNGIDVDENCVSSDPNILAIGDCANHPNLLYGKRLRIESVPNAVEQARTAAATMCGKSRPYHSVPWFWSDQYDLKLKSVGLSDDYDQVVKRGSMETPSFALFYVREKVVVAVDTINRMPDFNTAKRLVAERSVIEDPLQFSDEDISLASFLVRA